MNALFIRCYTDEKAGKIPCYQFAMLKNFLIFFRRMISECGYNTGQGCEEGVGMKAYITGKIHLPENGIKIIQHLPLEYIELVEKIFVDRTFHEKIHQHPEILVMLCEIFNKDAGYLFNGSVRRIVDPLIEMLKNFLDAPIKGFRKQRLLIGEMTIDKGRRDARPLSDNPHVNLVERFGGEFLFRGINDDLPPGILLFFFQI